MASTAESFVEAFSDSVDKQSPVEKIGINDGWNFYIEILSIREYFS